MMMKYVIIIALVLVLAWSVQRVARRARRGGGCCGEHEASLGRIRVRDRNRAHYPYEITLNIGGMTCENCARRVENALNALDGVWASVDLSGHTARVRAKTEPDRQALSEAVRRAGYVVLT